MNHFLRDLQQSFCLSEFSFPPPSLQIWYKYLYLPKNNYFKASWESFYCKLDLPQNRNFQTHLFWMTNKFPFTLDFYYHTRMNYFSSTLFHQKLHLKIQINYLPNWWRTIFCHIQIPNLASNTYIIKSFLE